jgi:hypothetical protein
MFHDYSKCINGNVMNAHRNLYSVLLLHCLIKITITISTRMHDIGGVLHKKTILVGK